MNELDTVANAIFGKPFDALEVYEQNRVSDAITGYVPGVPAP